MDEKKLMFNPSGSDIQAVRSQLLDRGLLYFAALAPLALVLSGARIFTSGWHPIYAFYSGLAVFVIAIAVFRKRLSYSVRVYSLLLPLFLMGTTALFVFGMLGSGFLILFTFAILMAIAFGIRAGLIACAIDIGVIIAAGIVVCTEMLTPHFNIAEYAVATTSWTSKIVIFFLFAPATILALGVVYNHLVSSLHNLKQSEKKYRTLFDSANDAIFLMENDHFVDCNIKTLEMFEVTRNQIIGQTPYRFSPAQQPNGKNSKKSAIEKIKAVLEGKSQFFEWQHCRYDGTLFYAEVSLTEMSVGEKRYILSIVRDITQRKELEEENSITAKHLQQAHKMDALGTLAGGIAHDFNNILSSVLGFAELVKYDLPQEAGDSRDNIESVIKAGLRAKELVQHILTFSRSAETEKGPVMPSLLIKEAVKLLRASLPASIETKVQLKDDGAAVFGDASHIHQVIMNLCVNAAHAMKSEGGLLEIRLEKKTIIENNSNEYKEAAPGDYLELTVSDTGRGIPDDLIDKIFDPFFTTKERGEGSGMGLSVAHGIVKDMGGFLRVESKTGKGSVFFVLMPIYEGTIVAVPEEDLQPPQKGKGRILLVDDEPDITLTAGRFLQRLGFEVTTHNRSTDALESFLKNPEAFELVITDYSMPRMNGVDLSKKIVGARPGIPIILCTGFSEGLTQEILDEIGIHSLLMKPLIFAKLADAAKRAIEKIH